VTDQPKLTAEEAREIVKALRIGDAIFCYAKCWPCQFGDCIEGPHTWMDDEDAAHAGLTVPKTAEQWAALAVEKPCGCHCNQRAGEPS